MDIHIFAGQTQTNFLTREVGGSWTLPVSVAIAIYNYVDHPSVLDHPSIVHHSLFNGKNIKLGPFYKFFYQNWLVL